MMEAGVKERPQERGGELTGEELTERPQRNKNSTACEATHAESIHRPSRARAETELAEASEDILVASIKAF